MNQQEFEALTNDISNDARVLYCLGIRPLVDAHTGITQEIKYKDFLRLLNGKHVAYNRGRQINKLILELQGFGLINFIGDIEPTRSFNTQRLLLPLVISEQDRYRDLHGQKQPLDLDWKPDQALFVDLAALLGIIDKDYQAEELGEFIAYWLGRPDTLLTPYQWTHKYVQHLKKSRQTTAIPKGASAQKQLMTQIIANKPEVLGDSNTKQLVKKYRGKHRP